MTGYGYSPREHNGNARRKRQHSGASVFAFSLTALLAFATAPMILEAGTVPYVIIEMVREPVMQFLPFPTLYGALLAATGSKWLYSLGQFLVCAAITVCLMVLFYVATIA